MGRLRATFISDSGDLLLQAVDKVRRAEVHLGGQGGWEALHKSQWLWRKNPENLTELEQKCLAGIRDKSLIRQGPPFQQAKIASF